LNNIEGAADQYRQLKIAVEENEKYSHRFAVSIFILYKKYLPLIGLSSTE
jgi:hypothetical protein